jgi:hypothetical protein
MAARTTKIRHDDETRAKIQASQLINRLQDHVLSDLDLKPTQVQAALGLLKKTLPDLTATELSGDQDNPVAVTQIQRTIIDPVRDTDSQGTPPTP